MKTLLFLFSLLFFNVPNKSLNEFLDSNYSGGSDVFFETMYKEILYPKEARANCRVGKLIATVFINEVGEIESIEFVGQLDYGIEEQAKKTLMLSSGNWIKSQDKREFEITIAYKLNDMPDIQGDITVSAYLSDDNAKEHPLCEPNESLLKYFETCMKKKDYNKAKEVTQELLRRDPVSKVYQNMKEKIIGEVGKKN